MIGRFIASIALATACTAGVAWADDAQESPENFLHRYYTALHKAKTVMELDPYCTPMPEKERQKQLAMLKEMPELAQFAIEMLKGEPDNVKVLSKRQEGDKLFMEVAPDPVPAQFAEQAKSPDFSMKGEVVLVADGKSWKVHKDHWTVLEKSKDGSSKTSFGRNPDGKDKPAE